MTFGHNLNNKKFNNVDPHMYLTCTTEEDIFEQRNIFIVIYDYGHLSEFTLFASVSLSNLDV